MVGKGCWDDAVRSLEVCGDGDVSYVVADVVQGFCMRTGWCVESGHV